MTKWLSFPALAIVFILSPVLVLADEPAAEKGDLWICPGAEMALYSISSVAYGGGIALGYGTGASIGLKAAFFWDNESRIDTLEMGLLLRFYFFGKDAYSGPFIQFSGGPVFFYKRDSSMSRNSDIDIPAEWGMISAGLNLGWRFLLGKGFFIEPSVRGGYPFITGMAFCAGARF